MGGYLLGIDNGLTVVKAVMFDTDGNELGMHSVGTCLEKGDGNILEMDLNILWENTAIAIRKAIENAGVNPKDILTIANSATGNGLYFTDLEGKPYHRAILPMDNRSQGIIEQWRTQGIEDKAFEYTTQKLWPGQPAPILRWLKLNKPEVYYHIGKILFCKDWLKLKLTGEHSSDFSDVSSAGLLDNVKKEYEHELFELYGIKEVIPFLPKILKSHEICGYVTKKAAEETGLSEGTPVAAGVFDVDACCIGSGVINPSIYGIIAGTWSINSVISENVVKSKEIVQCTVFADGKSYLNIDSGATSMVNYEWFLNNLVQEYFKKCYLECDKAIQKYKADEISIMFLPYLYSPIKYPKLNASFIGINAHNNLEDLMRSVFEGVALGHRDNIESLKKCGFVRSKARFTGGAAKSKAWCEIFTDAIGIEIETVKSKQAGALGAAIVAGIAAGVYKDYSDAVAKVVEIENSYKPVASNTIMYNKKYDKFKKLIEALNLL